MPESSTLPRRPRVLCRSNKLPNPPEHIQMDLEISECPKIDSPIQNRKNANCTPKHSLFESGHNVSPARANTPKPTRTLCEQARTSPNKMKQNETRCNKIKHPANDSSPNSEPMTKAHFPHFRAPFRHSRAPFRHSRAGGNLEPLKSEAASTSGRTANLTSRDPLSQAEIHAENPLPSGSPSPNPSCREHLDD